MNRKKKRSQYFHITPQKTYGTDYDFGWLEARLAEIGFLLLFCTRTSEAFAAVREERLKISRNPSQYDNMQFFIDEQEQMRELVSQSILPTLELDISDNDVNATADRAADWMESTNGLWSK